MLHDDLVTRAFSDSERASARAGLEVRELTTVAEFDEARLVWDTAWPQPQGGTEMTAHLVRALHHSGAYVSGAYVGDEIVGACLAFVGRGQEPDGSWHTHLHSHVAAAMPGRTDRGLAEAPPEGLGARRGARPHRVDLRPAGAP